MKFRGSLRPSRWTTSYGLLNGPAARELGVAVWQTGNRSRKSPLLSKVHVRGAKRTTTIKASSLPQGVLPPLPPTESIQPEKTYPTVLQQHLNNVRKFSDCVVLTRVGDFYEMYFDQVEQYAPLVGLKTAKRATTLGDVSMAGFQHTQLDRYLKMFVQDLGKQVAISEQIRLPESERNSRRGGPMFDRKVTRIVTAGTLIDESFVDPFESNFLLAVHVDPKELAHLTDTGSIANRGAMRFGLAWVDVSSGDFYTQSCDASTLASAVSRIGPKEVVVRKGADQQHADALQRLIGEGTYSTEFFDGDQSMKAFADWNEVLERQVTTEELTAFSEQEKQAGNLVLSFIGEKLIDTNVRLQAPVRRSAEETMVIDRQSLRNLEIRATLRDGLTRGSLLQIFRRTVTNSGARLLSQRLVSPSLSLDVINRRLDLVQEFHEHDVLRERVIAYLQRTADTTRVLQRFSIAKGDADDMLSLARTINMVQQIADSLQTHVVQEYDVGSSTQDTDVEGSVKTRISVLSLADILARLMLAGPAKLAKSIASTIDEEGLSKQHAVEDEQALASEEMTADVVAADAAGKSSPKLARRASKQASLSAAQSTDDQDIWIMRRSASPALGQAHAKLDGLIATKQNLANKLRVATKAESLTLKWSAQLGHFIHIKGRDVTGRVAALDGAHSISSTKSTRSFHLTEWSQLGVQIDDAKRRIRTEESHVFTKLRAHILENLMHLRRNAAVLDELDVACSSATIAKERNLIRPILDTSTSHHIIGGRHPTVDIGLRTQGRQFTSNDCLVGQPSQSIYLITGPNMGGKSTYLRQNALITILAQTGSYVPADYAKIGLVDKIFSRVGSADNLYQDQSTFMVEMLETAAILKQATPRSFVIMDEVGRGTTPEDGLAVGYACLHHLQNVNRCRALFATHFHGLVDMTRGFEGLACFCTDVQEDGEGGWSYVHKMQRGANRQSHALRVARLAGMPEGAIEVAGKVLEGLGYGEKSSHTVDIKPAASAAAG
ncbi:MutS protein 1 [Oleoguttula sp. CCFEE 5521]